MYKKWWQASLSPGWRAKQVAGKRFLLEFEKFILCEQWYKFFLGLRRRNHKTRAFMPFM